MLQQIPWVTSQKEGFWQRWCTVIQPQCWWKFFQKEKGGCHATFDKYLVDARKCEWKTNQGHHWYGGHYFGCFFGIYSRKSNSKGWVHSNSSGFGKNVIFPWKGNNFPENWWRKCFSWLSRAGNLGLWGRAWFGFSGKGTLWGDSHLPQALSLDLPWKRISPWGGWRKEGCSFCEKNFQERILYLGIPNSKRCAEISGSWRRRSFFGCLCKSLQQTTPKVLYPCQQCLLVPVEQVWGSFVVQSSLVSVGASDCQSHFGGCQNGDCHTTLAEYPLGTFVGQDHPELQGYSTRHTPLFGRLGPSTPSFTPVGNESFFHRWFNFSRRGNGNRSKSERMGS